MKHARRHAIRAVVLAAIALSYADAALAGYTNFESSHVHPVDLTPSGDRLLAVNTPDALLEVFDIQVDGSLVPAAAIPVGLEPVTVRARSDTEAWVVNDLSDSVSIVDLALGLTVDTLFVGDEPTDVVFTGNRAFVAVSQEDAVKVYELSNLDAAPSVVPLFGRDVRALAVSNDGSEVYAVVLRSGNRTTILGVHHTFPGVVGLGLDPGRLAALGLRDIDCDGASPTYPPLPPGIVRNPLLIDPPDGVPKVGLIVQWNELAGQWQDELSQGWSHCLPYTLADSDLFIIDSADLAVTDVKHLGTTLFEVSVNPGNDKIYVPHTEARNLARFEHPLGVGGHVVDNRMAVVDPSMGNSVRLIDLNTHINRASDPATNLAERAASISQPGMMVWKNQSVGYLTAIGSRKLFRVDGGCLSGTCIFGSNRATPDAVEVGEGPTGVALRTAVQPADERLYVLNRISHSIAIVRASDLTLLEEIPLHDPSSDNTRLGRRFLYDAIDTSGHGDNACSSCHISGDLDGLAWDLGNPPGDFVPYSTPFDNVRFIVPLGGQPVECDPSVCASHDGFDPQKGPMTTQTLRGMLEPLHWRGDRPTMNDFNPAFVGLLGAADINTTLGTTPAGLSDEDMEVFRQFALEIHYPPNPFRDVDDTTPCGLRSIDPLCEVQPQGSLFAGNPTEGALMFDIHPSDANQPCKTCHTHPFGAAGGQLEGVEPAEPTSSAAAALFNGDADGSPHSDLKVPHLRNMYDKFGPVLADPGDTTMPATKTGFGHIHDGSIPDLFRFLSASVFNLSSANQAREVRDLVSFMFHFPTGTKPAVGRQVTLAEGTPPTGSAADENLLATLIAVGNTSDGARHCELVAATVADGRLRAYYLSGPDAWTTDAAGEPTLTTQQLRENAQQAITFLCTPLGSGPRLGADRDEDTVLNTDDCAPADATTQAEASTVEGLVLFNDTVTRLVWDDQRPVTGESLRYDVLGGDLSALLSTGIDATTCIQDGLDVFLYTDVRPDPSSGEGYFYLVRARNPCGVASLGAGRESLTALACP
jgi:DNA-binding beta-propeller fold protein YncE